MKSSRKENEITLFLQGRVDSSNSAEITEELRSLGAFDKDAEVILDCGELDYISSAGLRVVLSLKRACRGVSMTEVSPEVYDVLEMTGFSEIINARRRFRTVSIAGCEVIGKGANGKVYRIDPETVVKAFSGENSLDEIDAERELARQAFVEGLPTAIPYDVVKIAEGGYGSVFELLNARNLAQLIASGEISAAEAAERSAGLLLQIHGTEARPGSVPDMKAIVLSWAEGLRGHLGVGCSERLEALISGVPDDPHLLHGDYHIKNIMMQGGELVLIDMDKLCCGHPVFEFGAIFNAYKGFPAFDLEGAESYLGIKGADAEILWRRTAECYLGSDDQRLIDELECKAAVIGYTHMMHRRIRKGGLETESGRREAAFCREKLEELVPSLDTLEFLGQRG
jgi:anti-anti-sigma factor